LVLNEKISPQKFAEKIASVKGESDIEYIQPDYKMSVSSLDSQTESFSVTVKADTTNTTSGTTTDKTTTTTDETSKAADTTTTPIDGTADATATTDQTADTAQSNKIIVAVIDTGIDITHNDLSDKIWTNTAEIAGNGVDDDGNGYVDDVNGWNFFSNNNVVYDASLGLDQAHGTHIAGIIAGKSNADAALTTNQSNVVIMPIKVFEGGVAYTSDIIKSIQYADKMGAKIINCSFGCSENNLALKEAMQDSSALFVCAVGNSNSNIDNTPIYPAAFGLDNIISVASVNADGGLSYFSNYGQNSVDIAALGRNIESTYPNNQRGLFSGTSEAAAVVSGGAARVLSQDNGLSAVQLKAKLTNGADRISSLTSKVIDASRLNILDSLAGLNKTQITTIAYEEDINKTLTMTDSEKMQLFTSAETVKIDAGSKYTLILKSDGTVWSWGNSGYGKCGVSNISFDTDGFSSLNMVTGLSNVVEISAGTYHSLAVKSDGTVWSWGLNYYGEWETEQQLTG
jgi:hypothetical protein